MPRGHVSIQEIRAVRAMTSSKKDEPAFATPRSLVTNYGSALLRPSSLVEDSVGSRSLGNDPL